MARSGQSRPSARGHRLGIVLFTYTNSKCNSYDSEFDKQLRELRPDWFVSRSDLANQKKRKLINMAVNGEPRPSERKHKLGSVLSAYTNPKHGCYDFEFDSKMRTIRPDWFLSRSDKTNQKKKTLLEMARNGESRPNSIKHSLGGSFRTYVDCKSKSYDLEFDKQIRELRPDWFRK